MYLLLSMAIQVKQVPLCLMIKRIILKLDSEHEDIFYKFYFARLFLIEKMNLQLHVQVLVN
jgi:hypothetical protein